ncbi:hypothetical protein HPP_1630 [Hydrangea phyllody phytoplasma]|uniref:Uncharacterized protein n=3 Tax=16SrI (Aster yellows group) TaxID=3042590 RepID=A0ABQ5PTL0_9MOLU|nr:MULTISPECIES: hypothetical protein [16SrI (Aster yellows group)]MBS2994162.1 hypothetical protein ['Santalum album' aster yellows phytoplasma]GFZ75205.1 hypothetical protein HPP_1630 [Hydrangea phyllody phytoplasma]GLH61420.1 hypothetical protein RHYP_3660 [Rhus yellows phytoplasma]GLH61755.1 hypothetical protein HP2P_1620 [Hydrangea phyllody phytoplasma]
MQIKNIYLRPHNSQTFPQQIKTYIKTNINPSFWGFVSNYPCYNSETIQTYPCLLCRIKDASSDLLGVFFDGGTRTASFKGEIKYSLDDLKQMLNGAQNMYIFWKERS